MQQLSYTKFLRAIEDVVKYARVKRFWFHTKAWIPKRVYDALLAELPNCTETERRLLGEATDKIIASAVPKSGNASGSFPGYYISFPALKQLERALRKDRLDWRIAYHTRGSIPGADYWGIDD